MGTTTRRGRRSISFLVSCPKGRKNRPLRSWSSGLTESSNLLHKVLIFRMYIKSVNESLMQHPATQPTSTGEAQQGLSSFWIRPGGSHTRAQKSRIAMAHCFTSSSPAGFTTNAAAQRAYARTMSSSRTDAVQITTGIEASWGMSLISSRTSRPHAPTRTSISFEPFRLTSPPKISIRR